MANFILQPCKIVGARIVPLNEPAWEGNWEELCQFLAPELSKETERNLAGIQAGRFCGLVRGKVTGTRVPFVIIPKSGAPSSIEFMLKAEPTVVDRIQSIYRVEVAEWDARVQEDHQVEGPPKQALPAVPLP
jgi:hypothetical protein